MATLGRVRGGAPFGDGREATVFEGICPKNLFPETFQKDIVGIYAAVT